MLFSLKISAIRHFFFPMLFLSMYVFGSNITDSTSALFERGAATYDTSLLKQASNLSIGERGTPDYLFRARCMWRIQVVKFLYADNKGAVVYGKRSLALLDSAEKAGIDVYSVTAIRALVTQILAGTGLAKGAVYGPLTGTYLSKLKNLQPSAFSTRLVEAFNFLEAPAFVGGDQDKALEAFAGLHRDYPDSAIVAINLARAMIKIKRVREADSLCTAVLKKWPEDLWAKTVKKGMQRNFKR
jgi:hypothetical protein